MLSSAASPAFAPHVPISPGVELQPLSEVAIYVQDGADKLGVDPKSNGRVK